MKIRPQYSEERSKLGELLENFDVVMLTFLDGNGTLISQPMCPIEMDTDGAVWFFIARTAEKMQHLDALNLAFNGAPDGVYVSLSGHGEMHLDVALKQKLWSPFVSPWFPDGPELPSLALLKFMPHTAEYWEAPHSKVIRLFAMAASIVAAKPVGLGEHAKLNHLG